MTAVEPEPMVHGTLMAGFAQACINLKIVAGRQAGELLADLDVTEWYPLRRWVQLEQMIGVTYQQVDPIRLKLGIEMMSLWYHRGPGREVIRRGADFLHFQTGSTGIVSVIRGPRELVGSFVLREFDAAAGRAVAQCWAAAQPAAAPIRAARRPAASRTTARR